MPCAFPVASLENVETIFLHRELQVLHVLEMTFKDRADFHQLFVSRRHFIRQIGNWVRRAYACNDVFALGVDQILAIKNFFTGRRIARKCDSRCARFPHVSEHHRLHIHGCPPFARDAVFPTINNRAIVHPRSKNRADRAPKLRLRILRKRFSRALFD